MNINRIENKVIFIIGATWGIGNAISEQLTPVEAFIRLVSIVTLSIIFLYGKTILG